MGRGAGHQSFYLVPLGCDVARAHAGIVADVLVEFGRAVVLPQPTEDESYRAGLARLRCALIGTAGECVIDFFGVGCGELVRWDAARNRNDCLGRAAILPFPVPEE